MVKTSRRAPIEDNTAVTLVTTAETVVLTLPAFSVDLPSRHVTLRALLVITPGAATTALTFRFRQGSLTGALIGSAIVDPVFGAVGVAETHIAELDLNPGEWAGQTVVVTVQQTAATGNGSVGHKVGEVQLA